MNIALVVHDLHEYGGHSFYARTIADQLAPQHDVTVFANRCERPGDARWEHIHVNAWRVNALSTVRTFPVGLRAHRRRLTEFDIQHAQGYCGGRPNVVTAHICVAAYLKSLKGIKGRTRASLNLMARAESRFYRRYKGAVIAISEKIANELRDLYRVDQDIAVIPHGVDSVRFSPMNRELHRAKVREELGIGEDRIAALFVGDLTKAHVYLKELAKAITNVQLIIVSRSTDYRWQAANVQFIDPTRQIERYYAAADAFLFPSSYDSFGMVVLEAMASGVPVFCADQAGASELITSGKDGFVFPLNHFVEATADYLRDVQSLQTIGIEAERTARRHDWESVARKVEQVYFAVAAQPSVATTAQVSDVYRYQQ